MNDVSGAIAKILLLVISLAWSVVVMIHAYGLTVASWPWLILGSLGTYILMAAGGVWSKK